MGLAKRLLGYMSAPFIGGRTEPTARWRDRDYSAASDSLDEDDFPTKFMPKTQTQQLVPWDIIREISPSGDTLFNREKGTVPLIPGRAVSAQTRLKNMNWEMPEAVWTQNPDGPAYTTRVPGLPQMVVNLPTQTQFTTQPEFLQPLTNLQIQNDISFIQQFRSMIFGQAQAQVVTQNQQEMFPSIFGTGDISVNLSGSE